MKLLRAARNIFTRLGVVLFGVSLAVLAFEILVGVVYPNDAYFVPDPLLGHRLKPAFEGWHSSFGEYRIRYHINAQGLRNAPLPFEKPGGQFRVLVLGDSFTAAFQVESEQTTPGQLESLLNAPGVEPTVEVINAGVPGYTTAQEVIYLENEGLRYEPDLVVVLFLVCNDVRDNQYFDHVDWSQERPIDEADVAGAGTLPKGYFERREKRRLQLAALNILFTEARDSAFVVRALGLADSYVPTYHELYSPEPVTEIETGWRVTQASLERLKRIGEQNGVPVAVVVWPCPHEYDEARWERLLDAYPLMSGYDPHLGVERTVELLDALDVAYLSLLPVFEDAQGDAGTEGPLDFPSDGHPTASGHRLAAGAIAGFLRDEGLLPDELQSALDAG